MSLLLSPAGNPACLVAGVQNGADEIYLGLDSFSARASADNFSLDNLGKWVRYAHVRGVKIHVALNTLLYGDELEKAYEMALEADRLGVDAFILQDIGLAVKLRGNVGAKLHASTQMTVMNIHGMREVKNLGFSRAVFARELSIDEIAELAGSGLMETEVFCHGALCMSYSGQCLLSFATAGRSGNRGTCSQPCRLKYSYNNDKNAALHLLSPADLCALPYLKKLTDTGVTSLKIEGRLKSPEYVAATVSAYRYALDHPGEDVSGLVKKLTVIFSRGGFCSGYQLGKLSPKDITLSYAGKTGLPAGEITLGANAVFRKNGVDLFTADAKVTEPLAAGDGFSFADFPEAGGTVNVIGKAGARASALLPGESGRITVSGAPPKRAGSRPYRIAKTVDHAYNKELQKTFAEGAEYRRVPVSAILAPAGGALTLTVDDGRNKVSAAVPFAEGESPDERTAAGIIAASGGTPFDVTDVAIAGGCGFFTFSSLKKLRREALAALEDVRGRRVP